MASTFLNLTLPASMLLTVVIPGFPDVNITNPRRIVLQRATLPDGYVAHPDIGVAYKISNSTATWTEARRQCISEGAHLADIDTPLKLAYLWTQKISSAVWTGIHQMYGSTEWVSSRTGLNMIDLPWKSGEPEGQNYCVEVAPYPHALISYSCYSQLKYVCEIPIRENYNAQGIDEIAKIVAN